MNPVDSTTWSEEYITRASLSPASGSEIHRKNHKFAWSEISQHSFWIGTIKIFQTSTNNLGFILCEHKFVTFGQTDWLVSKNYNKAVLIDKRIDLFKRTLQAFEIRPYVLSESVFFIGDQNMCTIWHFILMRGSIDAEMIANSCKVAGIGRIGRCHNWIQIHELDAFSLSLWIVVT